MAKKQITRNCHWVPQAYLKFFATDADNPVRVWRFGKSQSSDRELKKIKKVAVKHYLYVTENDDGTKDDSFERKLGELEQWFDNPYWKALGKMDMDLSDETLRKMVSLLAATMFLRNPAHFDTVKQIAARLADLKNHPYGVPDTIEIGGQVHEVDKESWYQDDIDSEDRLKRLWFSQIATATETAKIMKSMRWTMLVSEKPVFVTSDNPVMFLHPSLKFRGLNDPDTMICFPISPTHLLNMDHLHHEPNDAYYGLNSSPGVHNILALRYANEHIFSHRDPHEVCNEIVDAESEMAV